VLETAAGSEGARLATKVTTNRAAKYARLAKPKIAGAFDCCAELSFQHGGRIDSSSDHQDVAGHGVARASQASVQRTLATPHGTREGWHCQVRARQPYAPRKHLSFPIRQIRTEQIGHLAQRTKGERPRNGGID
jgi:hypothetical protein